MPRMRWTAVSPDHRLAVEARREGRRACLRLAGAPDQCQDSIALDALVFSDSGTHLAYPALVGGRWRVVRDGTPGRSWDGVAAPVFAPGGSRLAYAALDADAWRAVVNDSASEPWDSLYAGSLSFDPSGRRFAYVASRGNAWHAVVDGIAGPPFVRIARLTFSADGNHVAYVARGDAGAVLVLDGRVSAPHEAIGDVAFAADGSRTAYAARDRGRWYVGEARRTFGPYDSVRSLGYRPRDGVPVWVTREAEQQRVVEDGNRGPPWREVEDPVFDSAGIRWGYVAHDSAGTAIVVNDAVVAHEAWAANLVLSHDGTRAMWIAARSDTLAVVDDGGRHPFDLLIDGTLVLLRDGRTWACLAGDRRRKRLFIFVEGRQEQRPFDWSEVTRLLQREPGPAAVRAWVAAEGELVRTGARSAPR